MARQLLVLLSVCVGSSAWAQDAFLSSTVQRSLLEAGELEPVAAGLLSHGRVTSVERRYGVPTFFWAERVPSRASLRDQGVTPEQAARRYLLAHAPLYRADALKWAEARVQGVHDTGFGAVIVSFAQRVDGVRVFRDEIKVVMDPQLNLVAISGYLTPQLKVKSPFLLAEPAAIAAAYADLTGRGLETQTVSRPVEAEADYRWFTLAGQPKPARTRKVFFPLPEGLEPGFYVELNVERDVDDTTDSAMYGYVISARDGRVLYKKNYTVADSFNYKVWADTAAPFLPFDGPQGNSPSPHPTGTANGFAPPFVAPNMVTLGSLPFSKNDPWLPAGATETNGNNASAYADRVSPDGFTAGDVRAVTTSAGTFDRVYDVAKNPDSSEAQQMAAVTQLFYNVNAFHDWYYDDGFTEAAGNAQASNFGRGGLGNDPLDAEAQDYSGRSNADMSTPPDGSSPRMQMYIFSGGTPATLSVQGSSQTFRVGVANFGAQVFNVTAPALAPDDGDATNMGSLTDGCQPYTGAAGKVVLVDRGLCSFTEKAMIAQNAGAAALIIANNTRGSLPLQGTDPNVTIPLLSISQNSGTTLRNLIKAGTVNLVLNRVFVLDRDGTIDNAIVAHEWGHMISNRLIGDGNGLSSYQSVGMGEGWADFHSMMMVVKESDTQVTGNDKYQGVYALAAYTSAATSNQGYYFGIRRAPYSTDFSKNGFTFKHIEQGVALPAGMPVAYGADGSLNAETHSTGEVWCTMLWEAYASLLTATPRLTFAQAQARMRAYLVGGYKATPILPTFVDARDAILAVASAADNTDFSLLAQAFARRGLGLKAKAPDADSQTNGPLTESFLTGNAFEVIDVKLDDSVMACDQDGALDNEEKGKLKITLKNVGVGPLNALTGSVTTASSGVTIVGNGQLTFAAMPPFTTQVVEVPVSLNGLKGIQAIEFDLEVNEPGLAEPGPLKMKLPFRVNTDIAANSSFIDDVEAPTTTWTVSTDPRFVGGSNFRIFASSATTHHWFGPNPASFADNYLISPRLTVAPSGTFGVTFMHRFDFEVQNGTDAFDGAVVEISLDDGQTWADVGAALSPAYNATIDAMSNNLLRGRKVFGGRSDNYPQFNKQTVDLGTQYQGKTVRLRFRISSDEAAAAKGWEIDDIAFTGLAKPPFAAVVGDPTWCSNKPPEVGPLTPLTVAETNAVDLNVAITDPDGETPTWTWTQVDGPVVTLADGHFIAPNVSKDTMLTFALRVYDAKAEVGPLYRFVNVLDANGTPSLMVPPKVEVFEGNPVAIDATGQDPDGDVVTFVWTQTSGVTVNPPSMTLPTLSFTAPQVDQETVLTFTVVATDGFTSSPPQTVDVVVKDTPPYEAPVAGLTTDGPGKAPGCGCSSSAMPSLTVGILALWALRRRKVRPL
ncbi:MAG: myxosortase-dependent M36 family metallopeptidase [Myxococcaceae bacterium]|nr:myxosortase-dependent M36 family metallopeptidase [Myxococcaceae bacterium]